MPDMSGDSSPVLNDTGVDFSNDTQAMDFLGQMLDDTDLLVSGNAFARYFWYGAVAVIFVATICNILEKTILNLRCVFSASRRYQS